ncbi:MAG UNVERIFIED_CONTAM: VCBS repeat-containing protein [Anaerolineae bacterium]
MAQTLETQSTPLTASTCSGQFVARPLTIFTTVNADPIRMFNSNGSGLAIGDLNNDGLLDVVLANLDQPESILWNEGQLQFRHQELDIPGVTRSVIILDFDADGWRDILFTTQRAAPSWWRNENGSGTFTLTPLNGVANAAYAMNWGDLDADGDLDLVTGSYDAELSQLMTNDFLFNGGAGVYYYDNQDGNFVATRLAETAQALAVYFTDLNGDGQRDIAVGNDFAEFDRYWVRDAGTWVESTPFSVFTHSTMSFDSGDLNNDGTSELFATDMHPYSEDEATMSASGAGHANHDGHAHDGE